MMYKQLDCDFENEVSMYVNSELAPEYREQDDRLKIHFTDWGKILNDLA